MVSRLLINTIMKLLRSFPLVLFLISFAAIPGKTENVTGAAVIHEMNLARENPAAYVAHLEEIRASSTTHCLVLSEQRKIAAHEGFAALDEAIRFLKKTAPVQPLNLSPGLCRGAADHCAEQVGGAIGHGDPGKRISRYGKWGVSWGENISYGKTSARDIVLALIIDDGIPGRKHRTNIFSPKFNYAGAAYGPHARFGSMCSMDFAGAYFEKQQATAEASLVARNP